MARSAARRRATSARTTRGDAPPVACATCACNSASTLRSGRSGTEDSSAIRRQNYGASPRHARGHAFARRLRFRRPVPYTLPPPMLDFYNIDSQLSEEERAIRDSVRRFVDEKVLPIIGKAY